MTRGILLIAGGHPYYGKMAAALAATIKCADQDIAIHLCYAGDALNHLNASEWKLFNSWDRIPEWMYQTATGPSWIRAKMNMFQLTPFQETIFLDCDILWLKMPVSKLFAQLKPYDVTYANFGMGASVWAKHADVLKEYGPGNYWNVHSEFIYFKMTHKASEWFEWALDMYDNLKIKHIQFAGGIPDELPFSIAAAITKTDPHQALFRPIYWARTDSKGHKHAYEIADKYFGVSMAGHQNSNFEVDTYNILASAAYRKLGLRNPFIWKNKQSFLPERKNL